MEEIGLSLPERQFRALVRAILKKQQDELHDAQVSAIAQDRLKHSLRFNDCFRELEAACLKFVESISRTRQKEIETEVRKELHGR